MNARPLVRVLVIDDSALSRQAITRMLSSSPLIEVVGVARDGEEALRKTLELQPDLITLDLEMPRMDGFTFLRIVMTRRPTPVMIISGRSGEEDVFKALELGAVDFIAKPAPRGGPELDSIQQELIRKVHSIRDLRIEKVRQRLSMLPSLIRRGAQGIPPRLVAVGSSTGGPAALMHVLGSFAEAPAFGFVVAQHMPPGFTGSFAERLDRLTPMRAVEARGGEEPAPGTILLAPGGHHLSLEAQGRRVVAQVRPGAPADRYAPSVDRLFESASKHFGESLLCVVLTGMGDDGKQGVAVAKAAGASVIAESEETAVIFGMPQQAIRTGVVDLVLPLGDIAAVIQQGIPRSGSVVRGTRPDAGGEKGLGRGRR